MLTCVFSTPKTFFTFFLKEKTLLCLCLVLSSFFVCWGFKHFSIDLRIYYNVACKCVYMHVEVIPKFADENGDGSRTFLKDTTDECEMFCTGYSTIHIRIDLGKQL